MSKSSSAAPTWIGIDLGTTHCSVAVWDSSRGSAKWIRLGAYASADHNGKAGRLMPSALVLLTRAAASALPAAVRAHVEPLPSTVLANLNMRTATDIMVLIGAPALTLLDDAITSKSATLSAVQDALVTNSKRLLGSNKLQDVPLATRNSISCELVESVKAARSDAVCLRVKPLGAAAADDAHVDLSPTHVAAILLHTLRRAADAYLSKWRRKKQLHTPGEGLCQVAVIGVPAHFSRLARQRVQDAASWAGFDGTEQYAQQQPVLIESTAAALSYGVSIATPEQQDLTILVVDMGGGTTDVTVAQCRGRERGQNGAAWQVMLTLGDGQLGGNDMDEALARCVLDQQRQQSEVPTRSWDRLPFAERHELLRQCRHAKEKLTVEAAVSIQRPGRRTTITRDQFSVALAPLLTRLETLLGRALDQCGDKQINEVILIGGATLVPAVRNMVKNIFAVRNGPLFELCSSVHPMAAVAHGAAIQAALLSGHVPAHELSSALMLDTVPHALGIGMEVNTFVPVIAKDVPLPATGSATFVLAQRDQPGVSMTVAEWVDDGTTEPPLLVKVDDFTFLLHRLTKEQLEALPNGRREIEVGIKLHTDGALVVSVLDANDPEHMAKMARKLQKQGKVAFQSENGTTPLLPYDATTIARDDSREQLGLLFVCIALAVLYVLFKLVFADFRAAEEDL